MPAEELSIGKIQDESSSDPQNSEPSQNISNSVAEEESKANFISDTKKGDKEKEEKVENEWVDILGSGQLKMKIITKGQPDTRPQPPDICYLKLTGVLEDGTVVEKHESFQMQLGCHEVIQGLELAVPLMDLNDEAVVVVHPRFAYGSLGNPPNIPPNATITYNITLLKSEPEQDLENIPFTERKVMANNKKERGNWWYSRQDPTKAIQCYRKAIELLDETIPYIDKQENNVEYSNDEIRDVIEQKLIIYNNLAAAQLMIGAYESALLSVNRVIQCEPKNVKALFRKGKILKAKGEVNEAVETLRQAFMLEPENSAIKMELSRYVKVQQTEKQHEKSLYKKMLGQDKKEAKSSGPSKKKGSSWTKVLGTAATATVMAAIAIAVGYRLKNYSFL